MSVSEDGREWTFWGEIDLAVARDVREKLRSTLDGAPKVVDMRQVTFVDSSGLKLVVMPALGGTDVRVVGAPPIVREVFELTGLGELVQLDPP